MVISRKTSLFALRTAVAVAVLAGATCAWAGIQPDLTTGVGPGHTVCFAENWEGGQGLWSVTNGVWQVGGYNTVEGSNCAATNLSGNYPQYTNSRLVSPPFTLPAAPADGRLWLRYWSYFYIANDGDYARTEISVDGGAWTQIGTTIVRSGQTWTPVLVDLSDYAGQSVRIAFYFYDSADYPYATSLGWYLDEIQVFDGDFLVRSPDSFDAGRYAPDWEGWSASSGLWEIGEPSYGTGVPASGRRCAGTNLDGNYAETGNSRLISPPMELPADPVGGELYLSFMQYRNLADDGDVAYVEVWSAEGGWEQVSSNYVRYSGLWYESIIDLSAYAGRVVNVAFHMVDSYDYPYAEGPGWYIDDVAIVEGPKVFNTPDDFEGGCRGWYSTQGNWEIGTPTSGPGAAYSGEVCWGTRLKYNYAEGGSSYLITPSVVLSPEVPGGPLYLKFAQWYSFASDGDLGRVYAYPEGEDRVQIGTDLTNSSGGWNLFVEDISALAGKKVSFSFYLYDSSDYPYAEGPGWFIDDFEVSGLATSTPPSPLVTTVQYSAGAPVVNWFSVGGDPVYTAVYASRNQGFLPNLGNRILLSDADPTSLVDAPRPGYDHFYAVAYLDELGHEGLFTAQTSPVTGVGDDVVTPGISRLQGSHPNPFNPLTTISFCLERPARVQLAVYDLAGRRVAQLVDGLVPAGKHDVPFDARKQASGVYFCRLEVDGQIETHKMMLVR